MSKWERSLQFFGITYWALQYVGRASYTSGTSMLPTLQGGEIIWLNHLPNSEEKDKDLRVGDVVVYLIPRLSTRTYGLKRVLGLPGDAVFVRDVDYGYWVTVPRGKVWLQGDNTETSIDSRNFGPVPLSLVESKAKYLLWPFDREHKVFEPMVPANLTEVVVGPTKGVRNEQMTTSRSSVDADR